MRVGRPGERVEPSTDQRRVGRQRAGTARRRPGARAVVRRRPAASTATISSIVSMKTSSPSPVSSPARSGERPQHTERADHLGAGLLAARARPAPSDRPGARAAATPCRGMRRDQPRPGGAVRRLLLLQQGERVRAGRAQRGDLLADPAGALRRAAGATPRTRAGCGARSGGRTSPRRSRRAPPAPARRAGRGWPARRRRRSGRWSTRSASASPTSFVQPRLHGQQGDAGRCARPPASMSETSTSSGRSSSVQSLRQPGRVRVARSGRPAPRTAPGWPRRARAAASVSGRTARTVRQAAGTHLAQDTHRGSGTGGIVTRPGAGRRRSR